MLLPHVGRRPGDPQLSFAGAQQNKMKTCNADADAKGLSGEGKGEDRKAFMKECLRETGQGRGRHLSAEQNGKL